MAALTRESSFERVLSNLSRSYTTNYETVATQHEASRTISTWLKKSLKLKSVYKSMDAAEIAIIQISLSSLSELDSGAFMKGQEILASENFIQALSHFLNILPSDPSLKKRNKQARSVRVLSSAFLIAQFPGHVLEENGKPDLGVEAAECLQSAVVFKSSLLRLVRQLQLPSTPLYTFRNYLIGYRFALRNFLSAIDGWKQVDRDRLKHNFEVAYCESYMVLWTSQKVLEKIAERLRTCSEQDRPALLRESEEHTAFVQAGRARLGQFRDMLGQLLGARQGGALLEELDAYLLSSTQAMDIHVQLEQGQVESEGEGEGERQLGQGNTQQLSESLLGGDIITAPAPTSSHPPVLSPEATKLRRVSMITGMGENSILHELCLNARFQLPDLLPPLAPFNSGTDGYNPSAPSVTPQASDLAAIMQRSPVQGKNLLKTMMIRAIEDRFVANMTKSKIDSIAEVVVGGVYAVWFGPHELGAAAERGSSGAFVHAEVLRIDEGAQVLACKYLSDGVVEEGVAASRVKLASQARDPVRSGFLSFVEDMRSRIVALVPARSEMQTELRTAFDLDLLKQMVENDAICVTDVVNVLATIVNFITKLQSPHGSREFIEWFGPFATFLQSREDVDDAFVFVPKFFEVASDRLEQMQLEIANYYLSSLASSSLVTIDGPGMFKKTVDAKIRELACKESPSGAQEVNVQDLYVKYLPRTTVYLSAALTPLPSLVEFLTDVQALQPAGETEHVDMASLGVGSQGAVDVALMARAFSLQLQQTIDLATSEGALVLPETFLWDGKRLRNLKNEIDSLVLVTTLLISCRSFLLSAKRRLSVDQELALQDMLYEALRDSNVTLTDVVTTAQSFVRRNFGDDSAAAAAATPGASAAPLPAGWENVLDEALKKCVSQSSPVFGLFSKRVHAVLVKALLDVPFTDALARFSMNSRSQLQQLKLIIQMAKVLFSHNTKAFREVYSAIFRSSCK